MNQDKTTAIVLRRTDYGEADRVVQLITPLGRYSVIARGVRKEKSKLAGGIELLSESDVVIRKSKGKLDLLVSARMKNSYIAILNDYDRMMFAYETLKLVAKGSESIDEPHWYDIAQHTLESLCEPTIHLNLIKAWFYINYASLGGYELSLWRDVSGGEIDAESRYIYDVGERGLRVSDRGEIVAAHIKILRLLSAKRIDVVAKVGGTEQYLAELSTLARTHAAID